MRQTIWALTATVFAVVAPGQTSSGDEQAVRNLIQRFADLRNTHDGPAVASLYSENGEWISADGQITQGRDGLIRLWDGVTGHVERTITSIEFPSPNTAVIRVDTQYEEPIGRHHETFVLVKRKPCERCNDPGSWSIGIHQTND